MHTKTWTVKVFLSEEDRTTNARAVLHTGEAEELSAHGTASRNPHDPDVAEIGDEVATARALAALADTLLGTASADITAVTSDDTPLTR
jgi:hypothetical protein